MGCAGSKIDDLPLVTLCRERKQLLKEASEHRYAFAASHLSYFCSLKEVGDAFRKFVEEELVTGGSGSSPDSPVLTLPSDEGKSSSKQRKIRNSSSSTSISHSADDRLKEEEIHEDSHLHLSSGSDLDTDSDSGHIHIKESDEEGGHEHEHHHEQDEPSSSSYNGFNYPYYYAQQNFAYPPNQEDFSYPPTEQNFAYPPNQQDFSYPPTEQNFAYPPNQQNWEYPPNQQDWAYPPNRNYNMYYMKKSATPAKSVVYEEPERHYTGSSYGYGYGGPGYPPMYQNGGFFGFSMGSPPANDQQTSPPAKPQPPPSPPRVSTWDYLNVFDAYDNSNNYGMYPGSFGYGYGSNASSPDSTVVREREGIPPLEDETQPEVYKNEKKKNIINEEMNVNVKSGSNNKHKNVNFGEGTSRSVPVQNISNESPIIEKAEPKEVKNNSGSSIESIVSKGSEEGHMRKKGVTFEVEDSPISTVDIESSKLSSLTPLSVHGTRELQEVVKEIRDEFEIASSHGKEVAMLLEVGKLPYQRRTSPLLKVIFSRIMYLVAPFMLSSHPPPRGSARLSSRTMKMAKAYCGDPRKDFDIKSANLSSTLEKLYAWEKKLYKEVKDEEKLRVTYEKQCRRLRMLDDRGAESSKIDATQDSIRKLLTKINVCIRAVDSISSRIHKLRDEELRPQLTELIHGLIRMWRSMLKCHQKQFQAIMESKVHSLKANTGFRRDSGLKATLDLEMELMNWCSQFNNWVRSQKSYVESLNGWLLRCLLYEPEETPDGQAPFSPSRIGAPPIFVICNDWYQAMDRISEEEVAGAMSGFASTLHQLWERQDEEQRQRIKAEYTSKDFEKQLRTLRMEKGKLEHDQDALSDKTAVSKVSGSGVSPLDDLQVDLDSMKKKLEEERARHKEAIKLVHNAASSSLQSGFAPIFEALHKFTAEALKVHEEVRLDHHSGNS
ncbi:nitrate regulatory gene2 protein-like [Mangifera indica]|uniref:nitrate regulatory gene2 protein-like n=1 Tax=Mangifera indica TaxID=29780 RepID=UPI001CF9D54D|nr:nitrate regulatory gene2 protein-like [Mangifera indica]XP_044480383.1 nitrate regulatory gene2 protein-like [Mangifera indica]XP_044480384.1 nitrate regulatory gene2 protein-like [Mangifera indica]XP_044511343.1 nitrate regulatory gene2 protein-like [Mangifera indica]XP_044511344.1 nitrate regulatory gene2 protein-like [Mangifera indica]XP_044511345.1 nitrate regulatory gene2 protein-like [Mangifera indica]